MEEQFDGPDSSSSAVNLHATLEDALIPDLPASFYYIPNFITADEESALLSKIATQPANKWIHLSHRRLQVHPAPLNAKNVLFLPPKSASSDSPLPDWLAAPLLPRFARLGVFARTPHAAPNHVLVNEYAAGQGIMPHEDGAAYAGVTATVSLGSHGVLDVYRKDGDEGEAAAGKTPTWRILCEPRSLLVTRGDEAYAGCLHGIEAVEKDVGVKGVANWGLVGEKEKYEEGEAMRGTRVSLTCRDVVKVSRVGEKLLFGGKKR